MLGRLVGQDRKGLRRKQCGSVGDEVGEVFRYEGGAGSWFGEGDGGDVLRENERGKGVGLRGRQKGGVGGVGKISGPGVCRNEK